MELSGGKAILARDEFLSKSKDTFGVELDKADIIDLFIAVGGDRRGINAEQFNKLIKHL